MCHTEFSTGHALQSKKGGLVILRHNELCDEIADLASSAFAPSAVRDEPRIYPSQLSLPPVDPSPPPPVDPPPPPPPTNPTEHQPVVATPIDECGDLLIRGLFEHGTDCIIDFSVCDLDAQSYRDRPPAAVILSREWAKKNQYLQPCLDQRRHFVPFIASADGILGEEAQAVLRQLASQLSKRWSRPYSAVRGYVNARLSLALVRASHLCLRGSRVPTSSMSTHRYRWDDDAGTYCLFQQY